MLISLKNPETKLHMNLDSYKYLYRVIQRIQYTATCLFTLRFVVIC